MPGRTRFTPLCCIAMLVVAEAAAGQDEVHPDAPVTSPWRLRVTTPLAVVALDFASGHDQPSLLLLPDHYLKGVVSPDGARLAFARQDPDRPRGVDLYMSGLRQQLVRRITTDGIKVREYEWSSDARHIVYVSGIGDGTQVYLADLHADKISRISDGKAQSWQPHFTGDRRVAYLKLRQRQGKMQLVDLIVTDGETSNTIVTGEPITSHAWSPDGKRIAYGTHNAINVIDLETGAIQHRFDHQSIDERLFAHGARLLSWRPDGKLLACKLTFLGGRTVGTEIFGDDEIFFIPLDGGEPFWRGGPLAVTGLAWMSTERAEAIGRPIKVDDVPATPPHKLPPVPVAPPQPAFSR